MAGEQHERETKSALFVEILDEGGQGGERGILTRGGAWGGRCREIFIHSFIHYDNNAASINLFKGGVHQFA